MKVQNRNPEKVFKKGMISSATGRQQYLQIPQFFRTLKLSDLVESRKLSEAKEEVQDKRQREASMEESEEKEYPMKNNGRFS